MNDILARIRPSKQEAQQVQEAAKRIVDAAQSSLDRHGGGEATLQGSLAKGTWLAGGADVDLFLVLDADADLKGTVQAVGAEILQGAESKYAQHPYLVGMAEGLQVDLVPCVRVAQGSDKMTAVDRTPFHTAWVKEHLDARLRDDVLLAKAWCKGIGVYGADTATGGFSGYLLEVLVIRFGGFEPWLAWLSDGTAERQMAPLEPAPLVVADPVDPGRNCAAAVRQEVLALAEEAAQAYLARPTDRFFFPSPAAPLGPGEARAALAASKARWVGLELKSQAERLDIVLPQFQRAARMLAEGMERHGFKVQATQVDVYDEPWIGMQWYITGVPPETRTHQGPAPDVSPNAQRFKAKWQDHPDALGAPRVAGGVLVVDVQVRDRDPAQWLASHVAAVPGKHVAKALAEHRILDDPDQVGTLWAPMVGDFVLGRRPWQRP